jgi:hypothetical protein
MRTTSFEQTSACGDRRLRLLVLLATLAAAVLLSACGSSSSSSSSKGSSNTPKTLLSTKHIAAAIEQSIFSKRHLHAKVSCPRVVPQQAGRNFNCIAKIGKSTTPFVVIQKNDSGYVTYHSAE